MKNQRNLNIDVIRILATLMILTSHITGIIYVRPDFFGKPFWWINHIILSFCRLGVPLFFMISGYLLTQKKRGLSENFKKTFFRLIIPFLFFYMVSNLFFSYIHGEKPFKDFLVNLFYSGNNYLYFLVSLIVLYLINPFLQKITVALKRNEFKLLVVFLLCNTAFYTLGHFMTAGGVENVHSETFLYWFLNLGFFLYGQYLYQEKKEINAARDFSLFLIPIIVNIFISYFAKNSFLSDYAQSYLGISVIISSFFLFRILLYINLNGITKPLSDLIVELAKDSFGIYLIHSLILEYFLFRTPLTIDNGPFNPAIMIPLIWLSLIGCAFVFSWATRRIPYLSLALGER